MDVQFHFTARSDVGLVRENNQDSGYAGRHLLLLADGMGGPAGGDIASSVAVAHFVPLDDDTVPADQMLLLLRGALQGAHDELIDRSSVAPQLRGLGTTCIALLRSGNKLAMVHIGDSRAYLLRDGQLTQVTTDHSLVQYLVETGQITPEQAENHPKRSVILRVLGDTPGTVSADETLREAKVGDRWLLCSDGLSGVVSADTISEVMQTTTDLDECADRLIQLALLGGAPDNVTCVMADVVPSSETVPTQPQIVGAAATDRKAPSLMGYGAAAKAAALSAPSSAAAEPDTEPDLDDDRRRRRRGWIGPVLSLVVVVALLGTGLLAGWRWSQSQYFVLLQDNSVVVFQGIPQSVGPWDMSHPVEVTDISAGNLTLADRQRLQDPVTRSSYAEIQAYVAELRSHLIPAAPSTGDGGQSGATRESSQSGGPTTPRSPSPTTSGGT